MHGAADLGDAERAAFLDQVEPELRRDVERFLETTGVPTGAKS